MNVPLNLLVLASAVFSAPNFSYATNSTAVPTPILCDQFLETPKYQSKVIVSEFDPERGQYKVIYWRREIFRSEEFVTVTHRTNTVYQQTPALDLDTKAVEDFFAQIEPLVHLANSKFEDRRGWGAKTAQEIGVNPFSSKNLKVAKDYLETSSYVIVKDHAGRLLGGIRNIQMPDQPGQALPQENFLHIEVPKMGLAQTLPDITPWKNEVGTFVVDEVLSAELRRKVILEIWTHLIQFLFSKPSVRENYYDQAIHTYGDRASLLLYAPMGFKKLRLYRHHGKWVNYTSLADKDVPPIMIDNEPWWPLVLLPQDVRALNEKFSTLTRANVGPEWLENRRRDMTQPMESAFQMGALFPHLLEDLKSKDNRVFLGALTGLAEIIESAPEHMDVAHASFYDRSINEQAIQEVIRIRSELDMLVTSFEQRLAQMDSEQVYSVALFFGHILRLKERASNFLHMSELFRSGVFQILGSDNWAAALIMMRYLNVARTPKEWIEQTSLVWDLSLPGESPAAFDAGVLAARSRLNAELSGSGLSSDQISRSVEKLRAALFTPVQDNDQDGYSSNVFVKSDAAWVTIFTLPSGHSPRIVELFIQLAAVEQYLNDPPVN